MSTTLRTELGELLKYAAAALDIPDELHERAVSLYKEVGECLEDGDEETGRRRPEIYPQGSFRLGTVIRPLSDADEYDIDLVYRRDLDKASITQAQLKSDAGDHLKRYVRNVREAGGAAGPELDEGGRCWTLDFAAQFHMDVLPAIPDKDGPAESILITDTALRHWQFSNPKGYAKWFYERMRKVFNEKRGAIALESKAAAADVPEWRVKTPLQRAVQLLKRHRDHYFSGETAGRPASIIITTLAAHAYDEESDLYAALTNITRRMPAHIKRRNGVAWVANPVNEDENFADKWRQDPARERQFREWLTTVHDDFVHAAGLAGVHKIVESLGGRIGQSTMKKAAARMGVRLTEQRNAGTLKMAPGTGVLGSVGIGVKEHTFYGTARNKEY